MTDQDELPSMADDDTSAVPELDRIRHRRRGATAVAGAGAAAAIGAGRAAGATAPVHFVGIDGNRLRQIALSRVAAGKYVDGTGISPADRDHIVRQGQLFFNSSMSSEVPICFIWWWNGRGGLRCIFFQPNFLTS